MILLSLTTWWCFYITILPKIFFEQIQNWLRYRNCTINQNLSVLSTFRGATVHLTMAFSYSFLNDGESHTTISDSTIPKLHWLQDSYQSRNPPITPRLRVPLSNIWSFFFINVLPLMMQTTIFRTTPKRPKSPKERAFHRSRKRRELHRRDLLIKLPETFVDRLNVKVGLMLCWNALNIKQNCWWSVLFKL